VPSKAGAIESSFQCKVRLPFWCTTQNEGVVLTEVELVANAFDLVVRYSVGWKFVSVEDTFDTGQFCGTSEFAPKSGELGTLFIVGFGSKMPKEAFEG
jgi:hypothetical protein